MKCCAGVPAQLSAQGERDSRSAARFTVEWFELRGHYRVILAKGYGVFCDGRRITEAFETRDKAEAHCERIAKLYERWGW